MSHLKFPILEGPISSNMFGLADTGVGLNFGNIGYHQSVVKHHPNLVLKFAYLEDLGDIDPFNISGVYGVKEVKNGNVVS